MNNGMALMFEKGKETHTIWGVRSFDYDKKTKTLTIFLTSPVNDQKVFFCHNATVVNAHVTQCETCIWKNTLDILI